MSARVRAGTKLDCPIGGFFGLHTFNVCAHNLFDHWGLRPGRDLFFGNARSALACLLSQRRAKRVWLPAYICESAAEGAQAGASSVEYFPVDDALAPDTAFLDRRLRRGDFVLAVDYFGRVPNAAFHRLVAARRDVGWIEDRAQALGVGGAGWGQWELFSPRKLLGVPDGGILAQRGRSGRTGHSGHIGARRFAAPRIERMLAAQAARLDDCAHDNLPQAFAAYQRSEAAQTVAQNAMSQLTLSLLRAADARALARARRANWRCLQAMLAPFAAWRGAPGPAPFGYVVRVPDAGRTQAQLAAQGVFAQRHWARLPSPRRRFPDAHRLARQLLTLPCDHRYDARAMRAVARAVRKCLT